MFDRETTRRWYQHALVFERSPPSVRRAATRQYRCWMHRIAALPPEIGNKLDEMRAPLDLCRHVAFGKDAAERLARATSALAERAEGPKRRPRRDVQAELRDASDHVALDAELLAPVEILRSTLAELAERRPHAASRRRSQPVLPGRRRAASKRKSSRALRLPVTGLQRPQA